MKPIYICLLKKKDVKNENETTARNVYENAAYLDKRRTPKLARPVDGCAVDPPSSMRANGKLAPPTSPVT